VDDNLNQPYIDPFFAEEKIILIESIFIFSLHNVVQAKEYVLMSEDLEVSYEPSETSVRLQFTSKILSIPWSFCVAFSAEGKRLVGRMGLIFRQLE